MFKKLLSELIEAKTQSEITEILYKPTGVDMAFQKEKITWKEHEMLFAIAGKFCDAMK